MHLPRDFREWPIQWNHIQCCGADPCCHGNDIWARRRDLVAYRLVRLFVCLPQSGSVSKRSWDHDYYRGFKYLVRSASILSGHTSLDDEQLNTGMFFLLTLCLQLLLTSSRIVWTRVKSGAIESGNFFSPTPSSIHVSSIKIVATLSLRPTAYPQYSTISNQ